VVPAAKATLDRVAGLAVASDGAVLIADQADHLVRRVAPDGTISHDADGFDGFDGFQTCSWMPNDIDAASYESPTIADPCLSGALDQNIYSGDAPSSTAQGRRVVARERRSGCWPWRRANPRCGGPIVQRQLEHAEIIAAAHARRAPMMFAGAGLRL
jgi:hypothetical protein